MRGRGGGEGVEVTCQLLRGAQSVHGRAPAAVLLVVRLLRGLPWLMVVMMVMITTIRTW